MAIDAKMDFLGQVEQKLADKLTVNNMTSVLSIISDVMQEFDINAVTTYRQIDDLLGSFINAMRVEGRSENTINRYKYIIGRLMKFVSVSTRSITVHHIRSFIASEKARGIKDSTLEGTRQVFSAYFSWLQRESLIDRNPMANCGTIKVPKTKKQTYSDIDLERLNRGCKCIRDRAIVLFLATTGCRVSEMTSLNRDQVDTGKLRCVVHGKGNKERMVYFNAATGLALEQYLDSRNDSSEALFVGCRKERLQPNGVRVMLKELAKSVGVDHVHPHKFRRTLATNLSRKGMPVQQVAAILGHDKLDTTMTYIQMDDEDTDHSYRKYA